MSSPKQFKDRLKAFRTQKGWSQAVMGDKLGVSENYVGMLENGRAPGSTLEMLFDVIEKQNLPAEEPHQPVLASPRRTPARPAAPPAGSARGLMARAMNERRLDFKELAKLTKYKADVLRAVAEGRGQASEKMISAIAHALHLDARYLMEGSDDQVVREPMFGTYGATPPVDVGPGVGTPRYVPLISMAQAGTLSGSAFTDGGYTMEGTLAFAPKDPRAFGVTIRGDSMAPMFTEGDVAIVYPSWQPRNGAPVICRLDDEAGGDVLFKLYSTRDSGHRVVLSSYNPAYQPVDYERERFAWIYPVVSVTKTLIHGP